MVMTLIGPTTCSLDLVDNVVSERTREPNRSFFRSIAGEWRQRVAVYIAQRGSPGHVPTWPAIASKATSFKTLYSHPAEGSSQGAMLATLRDHELDLCPACGSPTVPETLDHYLPKGKYPHFAVTPFNLTPMCDPCQRRKSEKTGDHLTPRFFIHPYFDTFSIDQIVQLRIAPPFATPTFMLSAHSALTNPEAALVTTHLRELEIARRYVRFFRNEHRRLIRNVTNMRVKGLAVLENLESWQAGHADPTPNGWHHLFYDAVTSNADLVEYLVNDRLPLYP
ncbi:hypothetical protein [Phenylobacterium sp.]|uniref:hypothetical protein n=1 Tax=Phenylobacterium sp. TaxID=1871053 RepID=UPI0027306A8A|nr:hypothetical protein [Phenylobacterium sp.]MDP1598732.1 hypothetical protein [Phenylobacterium sp.]